VCGLIVGPSNQKNAKVGQKGRGLRHMTYFYKFGNPSISVERVKIETSNLVCGLIARHTYQKCKSRSKGAWSTSRDLLLLILGPLHTSGMGAARYFKFGVPIDGQANKSKNAKVDEKGSGLRHVTYLYNFGIRFISLEWVKIQTWSLVCGLRSRPANQKNAKVGQ